MACQSLVSQNFKNFEVCISDDCSTDGREHELLKFLEQSGLAFVYRKLRRNSRYDANLRAAIGLARGKYCFLLGNDDALASSDTLGSLYRTLNEFGDVSAVISNYESYSTGSKVRRIKRTGILGRGSNAALNHFRSFSFVSGILLDTVKAQSYTTEKWDGSEMYQVFLGCRLLADGGHLLGIEDTIIRKDIEIPGEHVDSYATKPRLNPCLIVERRLPMTMFGGLVVDAINPYLDKADKQRAIRSVFIQLFLITYPYWILQYRRVQSWKYALGVCLGMRPRNSLHGIDLSLSSNVSLRVIYLLASIAGLVAPIRLFDILFPYLYAFAKSLPERGVP